MKEVDVLLEQLDELLHEPIFDGEDALEVAIVAGLAERLGAPKYALVSSVEWREGEGKELLADGLQSVDFEQLVEEIDGLMGEDRDVVEDTLSDFDDVVAAAMWCGQRALIEEVSRRVAKSIRELPDSFACISSLGTALAALPAVGANPDIYDYWFAVAESKQWAESSS